jgi:hypothetical protein
MPVLIQTLFKVPKDGCDRKQALIWAKPYEDNLELALQECSRGDWLVWMLARLGVAPQQLIHAVCQCFDLVFSEDLEAWGDLPFRRGYYAVERFLDGESTIEECENVLDDLTLEEGLMEDRFDPIEMANEAVSYLVNAAIATSEGCRKSELAYELSWAIYTIANLREERQSPTNSQTIFSLEQFANQIRKSLSKEKIVVCVKSDSSNTKETIAIAFQ